MTTNSITASQLAAVIIFRSLSATYKSHHKIDSVFSKHLILVVSHVKNFAWTCQARNLYKRSASEMPNNNGNGDDFPEYDEAAYFAGRALSSTSFSFSSPRAVLQQKNICQGCGTSNRDVANWCCICRAPFPTKIKCTSCSEKINSTFKFCDICNSLTRASKHFPSERCR